MGRVTESNSGQRDTVEIIIETVTGRMLTPSGFINQFQASSLVERFNMRAECKFMITACVYTQAHTHTLTDTHSCIHI